MGGGVGTLSTQSRGRLPRLEPITDEAFRSVWGKVEKHFVKQPVPASGSSATARSSVTKQTIDSGNASVLMTNRATDHRIFAVFGSSTAVFHWRLK
jgi:hypothetical protein